MGRDVGISAQNKTEGIYLNRTSEKSALLNRLVNHVRVFNVDVMKRILDVLNDNPSSKITNLAMTSRLNYNTCKRYVYLMNIFDWLEIAYNGRNNIINLTDTGRTVHKALLDYTCN